MRLEKKKYFLCPMCGEKLKLPKTEELEMAIIFHPNEGLKKCFKNLFNFRSKFLKIRRIASIGSAYTLPIILKLFIGRVATNHSKKFFYNDVYKLRLKILFIF